MSTVASKLLQASTRFAPMAVRAAESKASSMWPSFRAMSYLQNEYSYSASSLARSIPDALAHPQLIRNALKAEKMMQAKDLFPCIHAQPAPFSLPMAVHHAASGAPAFFKPMRGPSLLYNMPVKSNLELVKEKMKKSDLGDSHPDVADAEISGNYSVLGHMEPEESALWFAFKRGYNKSRLSHAREMLEETLRSKGVSQSNMEQLMKEADPILQGYADLKVANLQVIGIPRQILGDVAYDSKPYGFETGKDITQFPKATPWYSNGDYSQLRLIMGKETLNPEHGMKVVTANDSSEVGAFCKDAFFTPAEESFMNTYAKSAKTAEEAEELQKRAKLDQQTQAFVKKVMSFIK